MCTRERESDSSQSGCSGTHRSPTIRKRVGRVQMSASLLRRAREKFRLWGVVVVVMAGPLCQFMRCCLTSAGAFALHAVPLSIFPSRSRTGFRRLCDRCFSLLFVYVLCTRREVDKRTRTTTSNRRFFWFGWAFSCAQIALNKKLFGQGLIIII